MGQLQTIGSHKTSVYTDDDGITKVIYHNTAVVRFGYDKHHVAAGGRFEGKQVITLDTGGYETHTTKSRMNQASNQFNLGYRVFQKNFEWFVEYKGQIIPFEGSTLTLS